MGMTTTKLQDPAMTGSSFGDRGARDAFGQVHSTLKGTFGHTETSTCDPVATEADTGLMTPLQIR